MEQSGGDSLVKDFNSMLLDTKSQSAAEIELIKSRMVLGKTINDLALNIDVRHKYFPIVGKEIVRFSVDEPGQIAVSRLDVPES
ncbi:MAG: hypothetical protein ACSLEN_11270 [Candidatus Malihini olakiniferum]